MMHALQTFRRSCAALAALTAIALARPAIRPANAQAARDDRLLFVSNRNAKNRFGLFTMRPDGTDATSISAGVAAGLEYDPVWSPDGKQIAFAAAPDTGRKQVEIYVMDADGSHRRP